MICEGCCCYYDINDECIHGSPIFDDEGNCTDYIEADYSKRIRADERAKVIEEVTNLIEQRLDMTCDIESCNDCNCCEVSAFRWLEEQLKEQSNNK